MHLPPFYKDTMTMTNPRHGHVHLIRTPWLALLLLSMACCGEPDTIIVQPHEWNESSLELIVYNMRRVTLPYRQSTTTNNAHVTPEEQSNMTFSFPLPCSYDETIMDNNDETGDPQYSFIPLPPRPDDYPYLIQESTSALLSAKVLAKTVLMQHRTAETPTPEQQTPRLDNFAWEMLDALLLQPELYHQNDTDADQDSHWFFQSRGLLPKYWYIPTRPLQSQQQQQQQQQQHHHQLQQSSTARIMEEEDDKKESMPHYLPSTRFPHWSFFANKDQHDDEKVKGISMQSSHRLSAIPFHASLLWDMMLAVIPPQHPEGDDDDDDDNPDDDGTHEFVWLRSWTNGNPHDHPSNPSTMLPYSYVYSENQQWWDRLDAYFQRIFQHHAYLHQVVMRGCVFEDKQQPEQDQQYDSKVLPRLGRLQSRGNGSSTLEAPCYNVLHPWESLIDPASPAWPVALQSVIEHVQETSWEVPFKIPSLVKESYDFPKQDPQVYDAMIYLLVEGWNQVNITQACLTNAKGHHGQHPSTIRHNQSTCAEDALWNATTASVPLFAMLDVGYAATLAQADSDLHQLALILQRVLPESSRSRRDLPPKIAKLQEWQEQNAQLLQEELWNPDRQTYMSKYMIVTSNDDDDKDGQQQVSMQWLDVAVSNNLVPFWNVAATGDAMDDSSDGPGSGSQNMRKGTDKIPANAKKSIIPVEDPEGNQVSALTREHWKDLSMQLLRRDGRYSFDCGRFPVWSLGCEEHAEDISLGLAMSKNVSSSPPIIQPVINYLIASGLYQNDKMDIISNYLSGQSLALLSDASHLHHHHHGPYYFGEAFGVQSPYPNLATLDVCGKTSTATAAIVYNLLVLDPTHANRLPLPPIRRSWVITLITAELFVAFSIGVSCLVISSSLVRKLRRSMDDDDFVLNWEAPGINGGSGNGGNVEPYYDSTGTSATGSDEGDSKDNLLPLLSDGINGVDSKEGVATTSIEATTSQSFFSTIGLN